MATKINEPATDLTDNNDALPGVKIAAMNAALKAVDTVFTALDNVIVRVLKRPRLAASPAMLAAFVLVRTINKRSEKLYDKLRTCVLAARDAGIDFNVNEDRAYDVTIAQVNQSRPAWKAEAITQAKLVAKLKGKKFSEEAYTAQVIAKTPVQKNDVLEVAKR